MPIWRNSSFNPISTSMSASQRRARSRTPWTISGETCHSDPRAGTSQETTFLRSGNTLPSRTSCPTRKNVCGCGDLYPITPNRRIRWLCCPPAAADLTHLPHYYSSTTLRESCSYARMTTPPSVGPIDSRTKNGCSNWLELVVTRANCFRTGVGDGNRTYLET